jgi:hypothetical protein
MQTKENVFFYKCILLPLGFYNFLIFVFFYSRIRYTELSTIVSGVILDVYLARTYILDI